ncbi:MAG: hypothetical protein L0221_18190 [Chloroflexi bacterium]|nr:hypothetical protein [Chloroflexota bacterium]
MNRRPPATVAAAVVVGALLLAPIALARLTLPDAATPTGLGRPIRQYSDAIWHLFDRTPLTYARFVEMETGPNSLVVLYFEVLSYPYLAPEAEVYLVSRCAPLDALDPNAMGGGTVEGESRSSDAELTYLRSDAQPPCEEATR